MPAARYGQAHQQLRAQLLAVLKPGTPCPQPVGGKICGQPMWPAVQALDLGHDDQGGYLGLVHRRCNQQAGAIKGNRGRGRTCITCRKKFRPARRRQRRCEICSAPAAVTPPAAQGW